MVAVRPYNYTACSIFCTVCTPSGKLAGWAWGLDQFFASVLSRRAKCGVFVKGLIMGNLSSVQQEWKPLCTDDLFEIQTDHPIVCMVNKQTKEHAYFDIKLDRFLSQQEAYDALSTGS